MQSVICPKCGKEVPFANVIPSQCCHCLAKIKIKDNAVESQPEEPQAATTSLVPIKDHSRKSRLGKAVQIREAADRIRQKQELIREERNRKQYPCGACGVLFSEQDIRDKLAVMDNDERIYCTSHVPTLTNCPDCSKEISRKATSCPYCGAPVTSHADKNKRRIAARLPAGDQQREHTTNAIGCVLALIVIVLVVVSLFDFRSDPPDSPGNAWNACQSFVRSNLKAPATAKFPWDGEKSGEKIGKGHYRFESYVDSENSFGALLRIHFSCTVRWTGGDNWQLMNLEFQK